MCASLRRSAAAAAVAVWFVAAGTAASGLWAQEATPQKFELKGVVKAIQPGFVQVQGSNGEVWVVKVDNTTKSLKMEGHADRSWLQPGMFVQFDNRFNARGQPVTLVSEVKIFTPTEKTQFGAVPLAERAEEVAVEQPVETMNMRVTGRLMGYKNDQISVMAGSTPVSVKLAPILTISVDVADYRLARAGDTIHVTGRYLVKGRGVADRMEIKGGAVFTAVKQEKR
jgi:hypothetical protein